jgi:hypothetical protein
VPGKGNEARIETINCENSVSILETSEPESFMGRSWSIEAFITFLLLPYQIVTNLLAYSNTDLFSYSPGSQKFKMGCRAVFFWRPEGRICFSALSSFQRPPAFFG